MIFLDVGEIWGNFLRFLSTTGAGAPALGFGTILGMQKTIALRDSYTPGTVVSLGVSDVTLTEKIFAIVFEDDTYIYDLVYNMDSAITALRDCEGEAPWALVLNTDATEEKDNAEGLNELQERLNTEAELLNDNYDTPKYGVVEI